MDIHIRMFYSRQVMTAKMIFLRVGWWCSVRLVKLPFDPSAYGFLGKGSDGIENNMCVNLP